MKAFDKEEFLEKYWRAVLEQQADELPYFFKEDACIRWHNTREQFTVNEFIRANCEYPGEWAGEWNGWKGGDQYNGCSRPQRMTPCLFMSYPLSGWMGIK
ncbi:MAG: hypothetical protein ACLUOI_24545 [Eisenbergiella sp.]